MFSVTSLYTTVSAVPVLWCRHTPWVTPNTERGTIELCRSGCVIPGRSVSDSLGTGICGSEVAKCEAVSTFSTVSGSELRFGARAVRCDASRLVQAGNVCV